MKEVDILKTFSRRVMVLFTATMLIIAFSITAASAATVNSYIYKDANNEYFEFQSTALTYGYGHPTLPDAALYQAYTQQAAVNTLKINNNYYGFSALTTRYGTLPEATRTLDNAVAVTTPVVRATRIAKIYSGTVIYEGPTVSSTSSLLLARVPGTDAKLWNCSLKTANTSNPIGPIKFLFSKDLKKTDLSSVSIYINDVRPSTLAEDIIKNLLFGEFYTRSNDTSTLNSLDGDIAMTYSELKNELSSYNGDASVTKVRIDAVAQDATTVSMTLNIN